MSERVVSRKIVRFYKVPAPKDTPYGNLPVVANKSIIDKLGLGDTILRLRQKGLSQEDIAVQLGLSKTQVRDWLNKFLESEPEQRVNVYKNSIFNLSERLEDVGSRLYTLLDDLEAGGVQGEGANKELQVKIIGQILQAIKLAGEVLEKVQLHKNNERFKEIILQVLEDFEPGARARCLKRLSEHSQNIAALRPLT